MARQKYRGSSYMRAAKSFGDYQKSLYEASDFSEIGKIEASAIEDRASRQQKLFGLASEALVTVDKWKGMKETESKVEEAVGKYEAQTGEQIDYSKVSLKDVISGDAKLSDYGKESFKFGDETYTKADMLAYGEKASTQKFDKMLGYESERTKDTSGSDYVESVQGSVEQMEGYTKTAAEGGISDEIRANQNPGNIQWSENIGKKYEGASKGSPYRDAEGNPYAEGHKYHGKFHTKFETVEQGREAARDVISKHWEEAGGDSAAFASSYTGEPIDSEVVKNYAGQIDRDLKGYTPEPKGEASGWKYGETRNQYSARIGKETTKQGIKDNPWLEQSDEEFWQEAEDDAFQQELQDYASENEISIKDLTRREKGELSIFDKIGDFIDNNKPMSAESLEESGLGEFAVTNEQELFDYSEEEKMMGEIHEPTEVNRNSKEGRHIATIDGKAAFTQEEIDAAMRGAEERIANRPSLLGSTMGYLFGPRDNLTSTRSLMEDLFGTK